MISDERLNEWKDIRPEPGKHWLYAEQLVDERAELATDLLSTRKELAELTEKLRLANEDAERLYDALLTSAPYPTPEYKQAIAQHEARQK